MAQRHLSFGPNDLKALLTLANEVKEWIAAAFIVKPPVIRRLPKVLEMVAIE